MKLQGSNSKQSGLTLIELMVAMLIGIILIGGVVGMFLSGRITYLDSENLSRMQESIRFASDYMVRDLRNAGYRDELSLRLGHESKIRQAYAATDGSVLTVRYAGRGSCTEAFDQYRVVENEYSMNSTTGELMCRGRSIPQVDMGSTPFPAFDDARALVGGLSNIDFQMICSDGSSSCSPCDLDAATTCIGVRVGLEFDAMRDIGGTGTHNRAIELTAAFRNVVLEQINTTVTP